LTVGLALSAIASLLVLPQPAAGSAFGCADGVESDFNGDGFSDTVVADPYATVAGVSEAGRVGVFYGADDGRIGEGGRAVVNQGRGSVSDEPGTGDRFGFALAVADIDCDTYTDLIVGTPFEDAGSVADTGLVQIVWGSATGLGVEVGRLSEQIDQSDFEGRVPAAGDQLGYAVDALEDVGDGPTQAPLAYALAIGVPGGNVSGRDDAGWVAFRTANDGGNSPLVVTQDTTGIPGDAEEDDRFGSSVSINHLLGSGGTVDAAVGAPNEDIGSLADAGSVTVVRDIYGNDVDGGVAFHQDSPGVPGAAEAGDRFGQSLDTARLGASAVSYLAVGAPGEDIGSARNAGVVQLFRSNLTILTPRPALSQDTAGVSGVAETGDQFGDRLAFGVLGRTESSIRLAVSAPGEDGAAIDTGLVQVFPVTNVAGEVSHSQSSPGIPGAAEAGDRFGAALAVVVGEQEQAIVVGVPDDVGHSTGMVDVIPFGDDPPRFWAPGTGGVTDDGASSFGAALGSVHG